MRAKRADSGSILHLMRCQQVNASLLSFLHISLEFDVFLLAKEKTANFFEIHLSAGKHSLLRKQPTGRSIGKGPQLLVNHIFYLPTAGDPVSSASDLNSAPDGDHENGASSIAAVEAAAIEAAAAAAAEAGASGQQSPSTQPTTSVRFFPTR